MASSAGRNPMSARERQARSEEHTSELQSQSNLVCRLLLEKKNNDKSDTRNITVPDICYVCTELSSSRRARSSCTCIRGEGLPIEARLRGVIRCDLDFLIK